MKAEFGADRHLLDRESIYGLVPHVLLCLLFMSTIYVY